jgi:hypothetical protein
MCHSLTTVSFELGSNLAQIEDYAFNDCRFLSCIEIPSSIEVWRIYLFLARVHHDSNLNDIQESNFLANLWFLGVCAIVLVSDILVGPAGSGTFPGVQMLPSLFRPDYPAMSF